VRLSETPFLVTSDEIKHAQSLEKAWDELKEFNDKYSRGVPITEVETARETYSVKYQAQMKFAQATGSFKSRRLEAFKELASFSMNQKEMKDFKLTRKTKEIALDNMADILNSYDAGDDTVDVELDKILVNMRPMMSEYECEIWSMINQENLLRLYGMKKTSNRGAKWLATHGLKIHAELVKYFPSVQNLSPLTDEPSG
jgi:hypothetical protein